MKTAKLCIGIVSIILSLIVSLQACALILSSATSESVRENAPSGLLLSFFLLTAGIVAIAARSSRGGAVATTILYAIGFMIGGATPMDGYEDIIVWMILCAAFGFIFFISIFTQKYKS